jgi:transcription termination factor Rho
MDGDRSGQGRRWRKRGKRGRGGGGGPGDGGGYGGPPAHDNRHPNGQHRHSGPHPNQRGGTASPSVVLDIDGEPILLPPDARKFEDLTSIDPQPRLTLEYPGCPASCRLIDLFCPIGRGQRGLIVSPPKAGKTTLLKDIGGSILRNHPQVELIILLIDERPEEMTDFRRTFASIEESLAPPDLVARGEAALAELSGQPPASPTPTTPSQSPAPQGTQAAPRKRCRVVGSSNDHTVERHIEAAMTTIERCKRMVEAGRHVVVLLDSLTRLGRAFNQSRKHAGSGRTMTGGLDSRALEVPRSLFGAARNTEEAGSLTIIASCLVDTGSAADQVIFEEFKGSGNMELILDRRIAERRLFPAINLAESGTRKEDKLMSEKELQTVTALRRRLMQMPPHMQVEQLLGAIKRYNTNGDMVGSN